MRYACIDVGLKRIGIATSFGFGVITPQKAVLRKNRTQASKEIKEFLNLWNIDILVVGVPSSHETTTKRIKHFVELIEFDKTIVYQDENMSSNEAKELIKGEMKQKRDGRIDSLSASIILQRYLK
ncbi:MAG: Holliday junction resolvase RuvX [Campylobacteraceae bacterium 4484_166]|nr:MAG: Holliday junction resolvase RuvX [Campylobacteraceae bacterium 4484_166]